MIAVLLLAATAGSSALQQLVAIDRRIQQAMVSNDASFLRRSIADDFEFRHSDGSVERKADVLKTAARRPRIYLRRDVPSADAQIYGRFALVFGRLDVTAGAEPSDPAGTKAFCYALNYVHVYRKSQRRWQLVSHRTTEITKPERPCVPRR